MCSLLQPIVSPNLQEKEIHAFCQWIGRTIRFVLSVFCCYRDHKASFSFIVGFVQHPLQQEYFLLLVEQFFLFTTPVKIRSLLQLESLWKVIMIEIKMFVQARLSCNFSDSQLVVNSHDLSWEKYSNDLFQSPVAWQIVFDRFLSSFHCRFCAMFTLRFQQQIKPYL